jgi:hypothetical protein
MNGKRPWRVAIVACTSLAFAACDGADALLGPDLGRHDVSVLQPIVVDGGSDCSVKSWVRDANGICHPPTGGGDGGDDGGGGWDGGGGGGGGTPPTEPDPEPCNTSDAQLDAPDVWRGFADLWQKSIDGGVERGGWIVQEGNGYRLVPFQNAHYMPCGIDIYESPPPGTVSMVHTHPWPLFTEDPCGNLNTGTPSTDDVEALQQLGLSTGYLLDANGIGRYTATGGPTAQRINRCGY